MFIILFRIAINDSMKNISLPRRSHAIYFEYKKKKRNETFPHHRLYLENTLIRRSMLNVMFLYYRARQHLQNISFLMMRNFNRINYRYLGGISVG